MPTTLPFSGARVPLANEANAVPVDLLRFGNDLDHLLVLKATDEADRDVKYSAVPVGTLVSATAKKAIWRRSSIGWDTVWSITDWTNVTTLLNDWTMPTQIAWKRIGDVVYWRGSLRVPTDYTGGTYLAAFNVPSEARPSLDGQQFAVSTASGWAMAVRCLAGVMQGYVESATTAVTPLSMTYLAV